MVVLTQPSKRARATSGGLERSVTATLDASADDSALPVGTTVIVPNDGGWLVRFESLFEVEVGLGEWRESSPLGRPVCASGAWQGSTFVADLYIITTPATRAAEPTRRRAVS